MREKYEIYFYAFIAYQIYIYIIYTLIFTNNIVLLYSFNLQITISKGLRMINFLDFGKFNVDTASRRLRFRNYIYVML